MRHRRGTLSELRQRVGWSAKKTRARLRSLEEAGRIEIDRSGRAYVFALVDQSEPSEPRVSRIQKPAQTKRSQLELISN